MFSVSVCACVGAHVLFVHVYLASVINYVLASRPICCEGGILCHKENMSASRHRRQGRFRVQWKGGEREKKKNKNDTSNLHDVEKQKINRADLFKEKRGVGGRGKGEGLNGI